MKHVEFFHKEHFERQYQRVPPPTSLEDFVDFFWETNFESLWKKYPEGFSDTLFPNIGYTYLINLGTPFIMRVNKKKFRMKTDGFLPRHEAIECYHQPGNKIFGIKLRVSPVIFEKEINFSEYRESIFPLSYLIDPSVIEKIKKAASFEARVKIACGYFQSIISHYPSRARRIQAVTAILDRCKRSDEFTASVSELASRFKISTRTLHRYFEKATGIGSKHVIQILRIRKATSHLAESPEDFHFTRYGYYDHSHFCKHLKQFLGQGAFRNLQPHLRLLEALHKKTRRAGTPLRS